MVSAKELFGAMSGIVAFLAIVPYFLSLRAGKTKPSQASWWVWTLGNLLLMIGYIHLGEITAAVLPGANVVRNIFIIIVSEKYGHSEWRKVDQVCLGVAIGSIIPWMLFKDPIWTIVILVGINIAGAISTMAKQIWQKGREDIITWIILSAAGLMMFLSLEDYGFKTMLFPVYLFLIGIPVIAIEMLLAKRK